MKSKLYKSKKGIGLDDAVPLVIFIFVAVIVLTATNSYAGNKENKMIAEIQFEKTIADGSAVLLDYIKQVDDKGIAKSHVIANLVSERKFDALKKDFTDYFNKRLGGSWSVDVRDSSKKTMLSVSNIQPNYGESFGEDTRTAHSVASVFVPINKPKPDYIEIELSIVK